MPNFTAEFVLYYLAREGGVAVQDDGHSIALGGVLGVELPRDSLALDDWVDDLEMGGIEQQADVDWLAAGGGARD